MGMAWTAPRPWFYNYIYFIQYSRATVHKRAPACHMVRGWAMPCHAAWHGCAMGASEEASAHMVHIIRHAWCTRRSQIQQMQFY